MMDAKARIELAKANLKRAEQAKITYETQRATAIQQREEVVAQMQGEGVTPETIGRIIAEEEAAIEENLTKFEQLLPKV